MAEGLMQRSCEDFAAELAAKKPVPGGGGAAALVGALGAALCSMVGNYTTGKAAYADVEADVERLLLRADAVRARLLDLVEEDARAFEPLSRAYGIPQDDPTRSQVLEKATVSACSAPLEMMRQTCAAIVLMEEMGEVGSKMLLSDIGCGAVLCRAALEAASMNVFVNTKSLQDRVFADSLESECDALLAEYVARAENVSASVMGQIREKE